MLEAPRLRQLIRRQKVTRPGRREPPRLLPCNARLPSMCCMIGVWQWPPQARARPARSCVEGSTGEFLTRWPSPSCLVLEVRRAFVDKSSTLARFVKYRESKADLTAQVRVLEIAAVFSARLQLLDSLGTSTCKPQHRNSVPLQTAQLLMCELHGGDDRLGHSGNVLSFCRCPTTACAAPNKIHML